MAKTFSDQISQYALGISALALAVAAVSAFYTAKQYRLNEARDERELEATQPSFDQVIKDAKDDVGTLELKVTNWSDRKLFVDDVTGGTFSGRVVFAWRDAENAELRTRQDRPRIAYRDPTPNLKSPFPEGIAARSSATWKGVIIFQEDRKIAERGDRFKLIYSYHIEGRKSRAERRIEWLPFPFALP